MKEISEIYQEYKKKQFIYCDAIQHIKNMQSIILNSGKELDENEKDEISLFLKAKGIAGIGYGKSSLTSDQIEKLKKDWGKDKLTKNLLAIKKSSEDDLEQKITDLNETLKNTRSHYLNLLCRRMVATMRPKELFFILADKDLEQLYELLHISKDIVSPKEDSNIRWYKLNRHIYDELWNKLKLKDEDDNKYKSIFSYFGWYLKNSLLQQMEVINLLTDNKNLVLTGAPGTGKTYMAKEIAKSLIGRDFKESGCKQFKMVQFHPSYDYTDFVEGLRPIQIGNDIKFERKDGVFKTFCKEALNQSDKNFVFLIDEINRGELSKIFGELFFSIDPSYRGTIGKIQTQYQNLITDEIDEFKDGFYVPENVYIIGTMNDIDRSVEAVDFAVRRRFAWFDVSWDYSFDSILGSLNDNNGKLKELKVKERFENLNKYIEEQLGDAFCIGGSYLLKLKSYINDEDPIKKLWDLHIKGVIKEYIRGNDILQLEEFEKKFVGNK